MSECPWLSESTEPRPSPRATVVLTAHHLYSCSNKATFLLPQSAACLPCASTQTRAQVFRFYYGASYSLVVRTPVQLVGVRPHPVCWPTRLTLQWTKCPVIMPLNFTFVNQPTGVAKGMSSTAKTPRELVPAVFANQMDLNSFRTAANDTYERSF